MNDQVYVIDNGENGGCIPTECGIKNYYVLKSQRPLGFAEANNMVLPSVLKHHQYICFLNQDTICEEGWLDRCISSLVGNLRLGAVMPFVTLYDGTGVDPACAQCFELANRLGNEDKVILRDNDTILAPEITAAAMVVKSSVLVEAGPFDPIFGSYCEDFDLGDRIKEKGYYLGICRNARVGHFSGSASLDRKALNAKSALSIRNRSLLACRRADSARWVVILKIFFVNFPRHLLDSRKPNGHSAYSALKAYTQLVRLLPRLISETYDRLCFQKYLTKIEWPKSLKNIHIR